MVAISYKRWKQTSRTWPGVWHGGRDGIGRSRECVVCILLLTGISPTTDLSAQSVTRCGTYGSSSLLRTDRPWSNGIIEEESHFTDASVRFAECLIQSLVTLSSCAPGRDNRETHLRGRWYAPLHLRSAEALRCQSNFLLLVMKTHSTPHPYEAIVICQLSYGDVLLLMDFHCAGSSDMVVWMNDSRCSCDNACIRSCMRDAMQHSKLHA